MGLPHLILISLILLIIILLFLVNLFIIHIFLSPLSPHIFLPSPLMTVDMFMTLQEMYLSLTPTPILEILQFPTYMTMKGTGGNLGRQLFLMNMMIRVIIRRRRRI